MGMPGQVFSLSLVHGNFLEPYNRTRDILEDFEMGGFALNDAQSRGLNYQVWHVTYDEITGDVTLTPERIGSPSVLFTLLGITEISLAFDQNMEWAVAYMLGDTAHFNWYDSTLPARVTLNLPAASKSIVACLDDHRKLQTQGPADMMIAYIRAGHAYYRDQSGARFVTEYDLGVTASLRIETMGMTDANRVEFDMRQGSSQRLSDIVEDICGFVNVTDIDVFPLRETLVRGFLTGGDYSAADALRSLQTPYFWDFPEIDGELVAVFRGGAIIATIPYEDIVIGEEIHIETAREQGVEFPRKLHVAYTPAESDYTPVKQTSERRSPDVRVRSELVVDIAINLEKDIAAQIADSLHKVSWAELEGHLTYGLDESYARFVPSDVISLEVRPGTYKRIRLAEINFVDGVFKHESFIDRASTYSSGVPGQASLPPTIPGPTISSETTWEFLDIPSINTDLVNFNVIGHGDPATAWSGAQLQRETSPSVWAGIDSIRGPTIMGISQEVVAAADPEVTDESNTILVNFPLTNPPESTTVAGILNGENMAILGTEIIQFQTVTPEGGDYRLSILARGRFDTGGQSHSTLERFGMLDTAVAVVQSSSLINTTLSLRMVSFGKDSVGATEYDYLWTGKSQQEWAPLDLVATLVGADWVVTWTPRTRLGSAATPLVSQHFIGWRIKFTETGGADDAEFHIVDPTMDVGTYTFTEASQTFQFGAPVTTLDDVEVWGYNQITRYGKVASTGSLP